MFQFWAAERDVRGHERSKSVRTKPLKIWLNPQARGVSCSGVRAYGFYSLIARLDAEVDFVAVEKEFLPAAL